MLHHLQLQNNMQVIVVATVHVLCVADSSSSSSTRNGSVKLKVYNWWSCDSYIYSYTDWLITVDCSIRVFTCPFYTC